MNGQSISGSILIDLASSYIKSLNSGGVPVIQSSWKYVADQRCAQIFSNAENAYASLLGLTKDRVLEVEEQYKLQLEYQSKVLAAFKSKTAPFGDYAKTFEQDLEVSSTGIYVLVQL